MALNNPAVRWLLLGGLLVIEIITITAGFEVPSPQYFFLAKPKGAWLFEFSKEYWQLVLWIIGACLLTISPAYKNIFGETNRYIKNYRWLIWLTLQMVSFALFVLTTAYLFKQPADPNRLTTGWFFAWFTMAGITFNLWLLALAPLAFWYWFLRTKCRELLTGLVLGVFVWQLIDMLIRQEAPLAQKELWGYFSVLTLKIVHFLVGLFYSDLVYDPQSAILGTVTFPVKVTYACSGVEGVSMVVIFLSIYLWLFKENLRFPQVFLLFPIGMIAIWLANSLRIALLIAVGSSISPEIASLGFHAQAGWIAFIIISIGAISLTHRMQFFSINANKQQKVEKNNLLSSALITPFLVQMAALMVTSAFSSHFDWLYPLRIVLIGYALYYFRTTYKNLFLSWNWQASFIGTGVFIVWILMETNHTESGMVLSQNIDALPRYWAIIWLIFRVVGSAIIIPLAEEFVFRGYLLRKLINSDFEQVSLSQFTWVSFTVSSLLFGLLHERWLAGTLAGMGYAFAVYRRGQLGDAVIAHMTTNALIAIVVLTQGKWSLWS